MTNSNNYIPPQRQQQLIQGADSILRSYADISATPDLEKWLAFQLNAQPYEIPIIRQRIQYRISQITQQRHLKARTITFLQQREAEYLKQVKLFRDFANQWQNRAGELKSEREQRQYIEDLRRVAKLNRGLPPDLISSNFFLDMSSIDHEYHNKIAAINYEEIASFYEDKAQQIRERLIACERLEIEKFTEELVNRITAEPFQEFSRQKNSKASSNSESKTQQGSSAVKTAGIVAGLLAAATLFGAAIFSSDQDQNK